MYKYVKGFICYLIIFTIAQAFFVPKGYSCEKHSGAAIQDVEVVDQNGRRLKVFQDLIKDKVVAINFIYTTCTEVCAPMSAIFSSVSQYAKLKKSSEKFQLISVVLDSNLDGARDLKKFSDKYKMGDNWSVVHGDSQKIKELLFRIKAIKEVKSGHSAFTIIGNHQKQKWETLPGFKSPYVIFNRMLSAK